MTLVGQNICFKVNNEIANIIRAEAEKEYMTVSQFMRKLMTETYKDRIIVKPQQQPNIEQQQQPQTITP